MQYEEQGIQYMKHDYNGHKSKTICNVVFLVSLRYPIEEEK